MPSPGMDGDAEGVATLLVPNAAAPSKLRSEGGDGERVCLGDNNPGERG